MTYPYFKVMTYGNSQDLSTWADHFKGLNIPYCITRRPRSKKNYDYALWIMGTEIMSRDNVGYAPNNEPLDGDIVETWGGFVSE